MIESMKKRIYHVNKASLEKMLSIRDTYRG